MTNELKNKIQGHDIDEFLILLKENLKAKETWERGKKFNVNLKRWKQPERNKKIFFNWIKLYRKSETCNRALKET